LATCGSCVFCAAVGAGHREARNPTTMSTNPPSTTTTMTTATTTGTEAPGDDDDIRTKCKSVKEAWRRSDKVDPIIECSVERPDHQDIKVVVTGAGWDFLGEHGKRQAFATSLVEAYKSHWRTFHDWTGENPAGYQVHIWKMNGLDLELAALISASGFYLGDQPVQ
jgi:hypothetical protein